MPYAHCPRCGHAFDKIVPLGDNRERLACPSCAFIMYINPKPTVKGLVMREGRVMMVRRAEAPGIGGWDFPGGYLEYDEHPEEGLIREIAEETGVVATINRLIGVYHRVWREERPDTAIINLAYLCDWVDGRGKVLQPKEIDGLEWVVPGQAPDWVAYGHYDEVMRDLGTA